MNIMAFDTATDTFSIGISTGTQSCFLSVDSAQKHSELIMDGADTLLRIAGINKTDLEAVACMEGPGSFTGLRIGFSAAKGLALALRIPIIPVPTLDCMAYSFSFWHGIVLPVIDAKKKAFFTALYSRGKRLCNYLDIGVEGIIKIISEIVAGQDLQSPSLFITGPATPMVRDSLEAAFPGTVSDCNSRKGYSVELLKLASDRCIIKTDKEQYASGPLYLRMSDAEIKSNMGNQDV